MKCILCPVEFKPGHHLQKYCSDVCSSKGKQISKNNWNFRNIELKRQIQTSYRTSNLSKMASKEAYNRAKKFQATPKWLNELDHLFFLEIYDLARKRNMQVDHIIPLKGKLVSGLHVPWNLQLLSRQENRLKSNHMEIE